MIYKQLFFSGDLHLSQTLTANGNYLLWREDLGIGYLPSNGFQYDQNYWENYQRYSSDSNGIGARLTAYRKSFVEKHCDLNLHCDVGIGSGEFVIAANCAGYDINPTAIKWLESTGRYGDPYQLTFNSLSLWDVLEHLVDPSQLLERADNIFVSLPIHENLAACLASKHLKPNEHIWHFTHRGIIKFMELEGFKLVEDGDGETEVGREAIRSYYFKRQSKS